MTLPKAYKLTIHYTNGTRDVFEIPRQGDEHTLAKRLDEFRQSTEVTIHTRDNKLIMIPFNNILKMEAEPFPDVYAKNTLHGAVLLEDES